MSIKLNLPTFDGTRGPVQATQFLSSMQSLFAANQVHNDRKAALGASALTPNSPAALWHANAVMDNANAFPNWQAFQTALEAEFCRPMTLAQNQMERKALQLKPDETANNFYQRVKYYHHNKDFTIPAATKQEQAYKDAFDIRVKDTFIEGLPANLLTKLQALDLNTVSCADLVTHTLQAQALMSTTASHYISGASLPTATTSATAASIDAINFRGRGRGGYSRGRGRGRGRGYYPQQPQRQQQRRPGPSQAELNARQAQQCGRCGLRVKHRTAECFVQLGPDGRPVRPPRRSLNAIDAPSQSPPIGVQQFAEPLNGFLG